MVSTSGLREGSVIATALDGMGRCGLWSRPQRGQGEGKWAEEQNSLVAYDRELWPGMTCQSVRVLCVRVRCWRGKWWAKPHTLLFSPTHPYDRKETEATQGETTGR